MTIKNVDRPIHKDQLEILDARDWYLKSGRFDLEEVLEGWIKKENRAIKRGFDGLRLAGNTSWLKKRMWKNFSSYERAVDNLIGKYRMIAVCSYSLSQCQPFEVLDVVNNHIFSLIKHHGKWEFIENALHRRTEKKIARLSKAVSQSIDGIAIYDLALKLIYVNEAFAQMHGYSPEEMIGMKVADLHDEEQVDEYKKDITEIITKGWWKGKIGKLRKDGTTFPSYISATLLKDEQGKPTNILTICRDITERKKAEEELKNTQESLRGLARHLQSLREEEKRRIARELHDDLGQALTVLKMRVSSIYKKLPKMQTSLLKSTKTLFQDIDNIINKIKEITSALKPSLLDEFGLIPAIEAHVKEFQVQTGIDCELSLSFEEKDIDIVEDLSQTIFRILQESLTNVARHAEATKVKIDLKKEDGLLLLKIKDDGKGITEAQISDPKSFGIIGIKERILSWDGEFKIEGSRRKGTTISLKIPTKK